MLLGLLVPFALTLLAWREGLRVLSTANDSKTRIGTRVWPVMLSLLAVVVMVLGLFVLRFAGPKPATIAGLVGWMFAIAVMASVAALVSSSWAMPRLRSVAFFAALAWAVCFGLVLVMLSALSGLR